MADYQAEYQSYNQPESNQYSANGAGNGTGNQGQGSFNQEFQPDVGTKRSYNQSQGGDSFTPAKRSRNQDDNVDFRCLIPSRTAGGIIGRGGSVIKQMREDFKAQIHVHDNDSDERVMQVGASIENCGKIVEQILPTITEGGRYENSEEEAKFSLRMLVHQSQAGGIIGLGGQTIRELRTKTGATIKVDQDCCPGSTDRICVISGSSTVVSSCIVSILELLLNIPPKGPIQNYDPGFSGDFGQPNDFGFQQFDNSGFRGGPRGRGGGNFRGRGGFDRGFNRGGRGFNQGFGNFNRGSGGMGGRGGPWGRGPRGGGPRGGPRGGRGFNRGQRGGPRGRGDRGNRGGGRGMF